MKFSLRSPAAASNKATFSGNSNTQYIRVLLYSHDSWGLGHLRRGLAIADAITTWFANADVLIITGSPCATQFELPARCDVLKLPAVSKDLQGLYIPRKLSGSDALCIL